MAVAEHYPALGFDPLPGDPRVARELADDARIFGERMTNQAAELRRMANPEGWTGEAAEAFTAGLAELPDDLEIAGQAFTGMAGALEQFHDRFLAAKERARALEGEARTARAELSQAQAVYEQPVFQPLGAPPPVRDRKPVEEAEGGLHEVVSRAQRLQDDFEDSVADLARTIYGWTAHAPREPVFDRLTRWAGEVFALAPLDFVREHAEFLDDLGNFLGSISAVLGIAAIPLFLVPGLGQFLALAALVTAGGAALLKTSLFTSGAVDANGKAYVSGTDLRNAWLGVALNAGGVGAAAGASQLGKIARGVEGSAGRAGFVRELGPLLRPDPASAWTDVQRLSALRQEMGAKGALVHLARMSKRQWDVLVPGERRAIAAGVLVDDIAGPMQAGDGLLGWKAVVALPSGFVDLLVQDAGAPDLRADVPPGTPGYAEFSAPGSGPRPVMGS